MNADAVWSEIVIPATVSRPRRQEASVAETDDGSLLLLWSEFTGTSDNHAATIMGARSDDRGRTWSDSWAVVDPGDRLNVMSPAVRRLPDGSLGMVYSDRVTTTDAHRVFLRSYDQGRSWTDRVVLPQVEAYTTGCHDRLTITSDGSLVAPLHCGADWHEHYFAVRCAVSSNLGATWRLGDPIRLPRVDKPQDLAGAWESGCIEPDVAERADGSLIVSLRTAMGTVFTATSTDGGLTWTSPRSAEVVNPIAPAMLRGIPGTSALWMVHNSDYDLGESLAGSRKTLSSAFSVDDGRTWPHHLRSVLVTAPGISVSYPSCAFLSDGSAFLTFRWGGDMTGDLPPGDPASWMGTRAMTLPRSWFDAHLNATSAVSASAASAREGVLR